MVAKNFRSRKKDLSPGSSVFTGDKKVDEVVITVFDYDEQQFFERQIENIDELIHLKKKAKNLWVNIAGLHDAASIEKISGMFGFHSGPILFQLGSFGG